MARSKSTFTIRKVETVSRYQARLELRGNDIRRFFRSPSKYLQVCLGNEGLKWRKVTVSGFDPATVKRALARDVAAVTINCGCVHVDFDFIHDPPWTCRWIAQPEATVIVIDRENP